MIEIPIRLVSTSNLREHWTKRRTRAATHRDGVHYALHGQPKPELPCVVTITRIAPRELDSDNLAISAKSARDGLADWLGINDNDPRVEWRYAQRKGRAGQYACGVEFA